MAPMQHDVWTEERAGFRAGLAGENALCGNPWAAGTDLWSAWLRGHFGALQWLGALDLGNETVH